MSSGYYTYNFASKPRRFRRKVIGNSLDKPSGNLLLAML